MRISILSLGVTAPLAQSLLQALAEYNADAYRRLPSLPRIDALNVRYIPDAVGRSIDLVAVDVMSRRPGDARIERVSCGSAAAAWAGWNLSRGRPANVELLEEYFPAWHAISRCGSATWDPKIALRERQAS